MHSRRHHILTQCLGAVTIITVLFYRLPLGQPQARSTPLQKSLTSPSESAALLKNGKSMKHQVHSNGVKNGAALLRAASSTSSSSSAAHHKNPKKLQSNPSINSQRSKGSSKSNSSQIPTEAQDGGYSFHLQSIYSLY